MNLPAKERLILELLVAGGESYGLDLVKRSEGELKRGTVYVTLQRMEEKGLVKARDVEALSGEQGPPRRVFSPTGYGAIVLRHHRAMGAAPRLGVAT
jgi:PadR family transcriptional regulator, regulatory protein PadR